MLIIGQGRLHAVPDMELMINIVFYKIITVKGLVKPAIRCAGIEFDTNRDLCNILS